MGNQKKLPRALGLAALKVCSLAYSTLFDQICLARVVYQQLPQLWHQLQQLCSADIALQHGRIAICFVSRANVEQPQSVASSLLGIHLLCFLADCYSAVFRRDSGFRGVVPNLTARIPSPPCPSSSSLVQQRVLVATSSEAVAHSSLQLPGSYRARAKPLVADAKGLALALGNILVALGAIALVPRAI